MTYDYREKKIVAVLNSQLEPGIALNVLGHLAISLGANAQNIMGRQYLLDASEVKHLGIAKYPLIITRVKESTLNKAITLARQNLDILVADYPQQMLDTGHDDELAQSLLLVPESEIRYLGALFFGPTEVVNTITGKFSLWKP